MHPDAQHALLNWHACIPVAHTIQRMHGMQCVEQGIGPHIKPIIMMLMASLFKQYSASGVHACMQGAGPGRT